MRKKAQFLLLVFVAVCCSLLYSDKVQAAEQPTYTIKKGKTKSITSIVNHNPLTKDKAKSTYRSLSWRSKNTSVVKVVNRKIKGVKKGVTYIQGYRKGKKVLAIKVTVGKPVSDLTVNTQSVSLMSGETFRLETTVKPTDASNKKVCFESSNKKVVTVSAKGKISTVGAGNAKIYVMSKDGHVKKKVSVKVFARTIRKTNYGKVKGKRLTNSLVWYGIPYGADTSGENRWRAPKEPISWSGTKSFTSQKASAAQYGDGKNAYTGTEDCLYVNVFRPDTNDTNLPVMVYLHGGGNASGNSNRNFSYFVKATNCIVVSVEYRLGAFGFLSHPALRDGTPEENSGNFTMLDIQKALLWVRDNIGYFGGDNGNVTLTGYSAGARDTMFCLISPIMKGLFHKAITFSGGAKTCTNSQGTTSVESKLALILVNRGEYKTTKEALSYIQNTATYKELRTLFDSLTTAEVANMYSSPGLRLDKFPQGFNDGVVISIDGFEAIQKGDYNRVPIILGSNTTEFASFGWSNRYIVLEEEEKKIGMNTMELLKKTIYYGSQLQSCHYIEEPAKMLLSDASHKAVYAYRFNWGTDATVTNTFFSQYAGASHGMDVNFLLGFYPNNYQQYSSGAISSKNKPGRLDLTDTMRKYVKNFLYKGKPNGSGLVEWTQWSELSEDKVMFFDADQKDDTSAMSPSYYSINEIFDRMREHLSEPVYDILVEYPLKGRFFMPEVVPSYTSTK